MTVSAQRLSALQALAADDHATASERAVAQRLAAREQRRLHPMPAAVRSRPVTPPAGVPVQVAWPAVVPDPVPVSWSEID